MNKKTKQRFVMNANDNQPSSTAQRLLETIAAAQVNLENVQEFSNVCRICATDTEFVIPIFEGEGLQNNLAEKIQKYLPITVTEQDVLPRVVCYQCASTLFAWHELVNCCVQADAALKSRLPKPPSAQQDVKPSVSGTSQPVNTNQKTKSRNTSAVPPPPSGDSSSSNVIIKICSICGLDLPEPMFEPHMVDKHPGMVFLCEECDSYIGMENFLVHMTDHDKEYTNAARFAQEQSQEPKVVQNKNKKDENDNTAPESVPETPPQDNTSPPNDTTNANESSSELGPIPESAIEIVDDSCDNTTAGQSTDQPASNDGAQTRSKSKKSRTCPICSKSYRASSSYFYHMKNFHGKKQEHGCDICGKKFASKANLTQHGFIHSKEYRYECKTCSKRFKGRANLYIHAQSHAGTPRHACAQCGRGFRWRSSLTKHEARHAAHKAHRCDACGRAFSTRCDLARHARTHARTRARFPCDSCGRSYAQQRYLNAHVTTKHSAPQNKNNKKTRTT